MRGSFNSTLHSSTLELQYISYRWLLWVEDKEGQEPPPPSSYGHLPLEKQDWARSLRGSYKNPKDQWISFSPKAWHAVTPVEGHRVFVALFSPQGVHRLSHEHQKQLRAAGFRFHLKEQCVSPQWISYLDKSGWLDPDLLEQPLSASLRRQLFKQTESVAEEMNKAQTKVWCNPRMQKILCGEWDSSLWSCVKVLGEEEEGKAKQGLGLGEVLPGRLPLVWVPSIPGTGQKGGCASRPFLLGVLVAPDRPSTEVGCFAVCSPVSILPWLDVAPGTDQRLAKSAPTDQTRVHFSVEVDLPDRCIPHQYHHGLGQCHIVQLWWAQGHSPPVGQGITQVRTRVTSRLIWIVDPWYQLDA